MTPSRLTRVERELRRAQTTQVCAPKRGVVLGSQFCGSSFLQTSARTRLYCRRNCRSCRLEEYYKLIKGKLPDGLGGHGLRRHAHADAVATETRNTSTRPW